MGGRGEVEVEEAAYGELCVGGGGGWTLHIPPPPMEEEEEEEEMGAPWPLARMHMSG